MCTYLFGREELAVYVSFCVFTYRGMLRYSSSTNGRRRKVRCRGGFFAPSQSNQGVMGAPSLTLDSMHAR